MSDVSGGPILYRVKPHAADGWLAAPLDCVFTWAHNMDEALSNSASAFGLRGDNLEVVALTRPGDKVGFTQVPYGTVQTKSIDWSMD